MNEYINLSRLRKEEEKMLSYRSFKLALKENLRSALVVTRFELLTVTLLEFQLLWDMKL